MCAEAAAPATMAAAATATFARSAYQYSLASGPVCVSALCAIAFFFFLFRRFCITLFFVASFLALSLSSSLLSDILSLLLLLFHSFAFIFVRARFLLYFVLSILALYVRSKFVWLSNALYVDLNASHYTCAPPNTHAHTRNEQVFVRR